MSAVGSIYEWQSARMLAGLLKCSQSGIYTAARTGTTCASYRIEGRDVTPEDGLPLQRRVFRALEDRAAVEVDKAEYEDLLADLAGCEARIEELEAINTNLRGELGHPDSVVIDMECELHEAEGRIAELEDTLRYRDERNAMLETKLSRLGAENAELREALRCETTDIIYDAATSEFTDNLREENERLHDELNAAVERLESSARFVDRLQDSYQSVITTHQRSAEKLREEHAQMTALLQRIADAAGTYDFSQAVVRVEEVMWHAADARKPRRTGLLRAWADVVLEWMEGRR